MVFIAEDIRGCVMSTQDSLKYFIASRSIYRFLREKVTRKKFFDKGKPDIWSAMEDKPTNWASGDLGLNSAN